MVIHTAIFVGYTFPTIDKIEIESNLTKIRSASKRFLPNRFTQEADGSTDKEYEVIFKVDIPMIDNDLEKVSLMRVLKNIFDETIELEPYFCSYNAKAAEKAREENGR